MRDNFVIMKDWFKEKPSLEDWVAAHNVTSQAHLERIEQAYARFMVSRNFWGVVF